MTSRKLVQANLEAFLAHRETLPVDRKHLLEQYRFADLALKVVGVGSVGTRCYIALLEGLYEGEPLFLQIKEAQASALEAYLPQSIYRNHGERVVSGQRLMQAAVDIFLGWIRGGDGRDYYWRHLHDIKSAFNIANLSAEELEFYAGLCGWTLARAHARSGDRVQIAGYLGKSDRFDLAVTEFAVSYADQTERDHAALVKAVKQGRVKASAGAS